MFDDGSEWYTRIVNCSDEAIKTEAGTHKRADIVHVNRIKWPGGNYSGVPSGEEHRLVRSYTKREKAFATRTINGTLNGKPITKRIKMLVLEKLADQADEHGVTEEYVVSRLKHWSDTDNRHALEALKTLCRIKGIELNQQTDKGADKPLGLFAQINGNVTIQQARRIESLPDAREIKSMIAQAGTPQEIEFESIDPPGDGEPRA